MEDSGYPCYERWKKNVIKNEGIERVITMVEREDSDVFNQK